MTMGLLVLLLLVVGAAGQSACNFGDPVATFPASAISEIQLDGEIYYSECSQSGEFQVPCTVNYYITEVNDIDAFTIYMTPVGALVPSNNGLLTFSLGNWTPGEPVG
jgi:hypothetical protein